MPNATSQLTQQCGGCKSLGKTRSETFAMPLSHGGGAAVHGDSIWRGCVRCRWIQSCAIAIALPSPMTQQAIQCRMGPFHGSQDPTRGCQRPCQLCMGAVGSSDSSRGREKKVRRLEYQHRTIAPSYRNILLFFRTLPLLPPQAIVAGGLCRNMKVR